MHTDAIRRNAYDEAVLRNALRSPVTESDEVDVLFEYLRRLDLPAGDFDIDALIDTAEMIDGLPFVRLPHVIEYKKIRNSAKDQLHRAQCKQEARN